MAQDSKNNFGVEEFGGSSNKVNAGDITILKVQDSFERNKKFIFGAVAAVIIAVVAFFGYKYFVQEPNEDKANRALFTVQNWFEVDSSNLVINGDGQHLGAVSIIKKYSGTEAANLAKYYVGLSYLKTGDFNSAIKNLSEFDGKGTVVGFLAQGALGDAYMEAGKTDQGLAAYKKAAGNEKDLYTASLYTFRAGLAAEKAGKMEEAKKLYMTVKEKYANTMPGMEIDKYLARIGELTID